MSQLSRRTETANCVQQRKKHIEIQNRKPDGRIISMLAAKTRVMCFGSDFDERNPKFLNVATNA